MTVDLATPPHETAGGRKRLAAKGQTAYGTSYPVPNVSYLKKALKAVGRVAPGKRATLGRFLRKRARELGATGVIKGSWADSSAGAKAMAQALEAALELARADGTLWELNHVVELVGPKGYIHGWIKVSGPMGHKAKVGQHVRVQRTAGPAYGQVIARSTGGKIDIRTRKGERLGSHEGMVTHVYQGEGPPKGGIKSAAEKAPGTPTQRAAGLKPGGTLTEQRAKLGMPPGMSKHSHEDNANPSNEFASDRTEFENHMVSVHSDVQVATGPKMSLAELRRRHDAAHSAVGGRSYAKPEKLSPAAAHEALTNYRAGRTGPRDEYGRPTTNPAAAKRLEALAAKHTGGGTPSKKPVFDSHTDAQLMGHKPGTYTVRRPSQKTFRREGAGSPNAQPGKTQTQLNAEKGLKRFDAITKQVGELPRGASVTPSLKNDRIRARRPDGTSKMFDSYAEAGNWARGGGTSAPRSFPAKNVHGTPEQKAHAASIAKSETARLKREAAGTSRPGEHAPGSRAEQAAVVSHTAHSELLKARTAARKAYPQGHPERLKAERAVRASRKTRRAGAGGGGGTTRAAGAPSTSRRRRTPVAAGSTSAPSTGKSVSERQAEVRGLSPAAQRTYAQAKLKGIGHERAMGVAKARPKPPKGTAAAKRRKITGEGKKPPKPIIAEAISAAKTPGTLDAGIETLTKALIARGWSPAEARKLARGRILHGEKIPQYGPGRKGPRQR